LRRLIFVVGGACRSVMKSSVKASRHTVGLLAMHHIYCPTKRDHIETRALQHDLSGLYLYGKPGMVVVEGNVDAVGQYIRFIRGLRWQACVCMGRVARIYHVDETLPAWKQEHTTDALIPVPVEHHVVHDSPVPAADRLWRDFQPVTTVEEMKQSLTAVGMSVAWTLLTREFRNAKLPPPPPNDLSASAPGRLPGSKADKPKKNR
jgi:hypothetical protein